MSLRCCTYLERVEFDVVLDSLVSPLSANQSLGIKHSVLRVAGQLILGSVSNQPLALSSEGNIGGSDTVTLVISNDLNTSILVDSNTE